MDAEAAVWMGMWLQVHSMDCSLGRMDFYNCTGKELTLNLTSKPPCYWRTNLATGSTNNFLTQLFCVPLPNISNAMHHGFVQSSPRKRAAYRSCMVPAVAIMHTICTV